MEKILFLEGKFREKIWGGKNERDRHLVSQR